MASCSSPILFEFYRGDDYALEINITDDQDALVDITDRRFKFTIKRRLNDSDKKAVLAYDTGVLSGTQAQAGVVHLDLTNAMTSNIAPGTYFFDIQYEYGDLSSTVIMGRLRVLADVTQGIG